MCCADGGGVHPVDPKCPCGFDGSVCHHQMSMTDNCASLSKILVVAGLGVRGLRCEDLRIEFGKPIIPGSRRKTSGPRRRTILSISKSLPGNARSFWVFNIALLQMRERFSPVPMPTQQLGEMTTCTSAISVIREPYIIPMLPIIHAIS
ncbi:unnamed protein product [Caenorhabditis brenneri]